jgi:hypothetical protein
VKFLDAERHDAEPAPDSREIIAAYIAERRTTQKSPLTTVGRYIPVESRRSLRSVE